MPSIYGPIIHGGQVEQAVTNHLKAWLPAYLAEIERQLPDRAPGELPAIRSWRNEPDNPERWPEDQLPCIVVMCPGTAERPMKQGGGLFEAVWDVRAAVVVSASTEAATNELAKLYTAATTAALVQHPSLGVFAEDLDWVGVVYDDISPQGRTLATGEVAITLRVKDVLDANAGPAVPPLDPLADPGDWPTVDTTDIQIEHEEIA